jgi:tetratricopeptide (TPR) repeat protein
VCVVTVLTLIAALLTGAQVERNRIAQLREDVAELMTAGQMAMNQDDVPFAQARFQEAWRLVQSEPALADHVPGVAGWLDHSGRAASQQHWQRRLPPREFDERRDEALIESLLLEPRSENAVQLAREAIAAALELTIANDVAWRTDRELLVLTEAELLAHSRGSAEALAHLDEYSEFASRRWNLRRAAYLTKLNRGKEAEEATSQAEEFPPDELGMRLLEGFRLIRSQNFDAALAEFEAVLAAEPAHFEARLCQAVCFLHLQRSQEAKIGLTACIAQRPDFPWSYYHRAQAWKASEDFSAAASDLQRALASKPSPTLRQSAEALQASLP